jgi:undecaprenyl-diphosphatase
MTTVPLLPEDHRDRRRVVAAALATLGALLLVRPGVVLAAAAEGDESLGQLMTWWKAAVLGVVEGITEYLPISSTGHLLVVSRLLGLPDERGSEGLQAVNAYAVAIQFGAIIAVAGLFWRRFRDMLRGLVGRSESGRHLLVVLVIAFLPSAAVGFLFDGPIEDALWGPWPIVVMWVLGGVVILALERSGRIPDRGAKAPPGVDVLRAITYRQALWIGIAQIVALAPGTSRSLATILGALLVGVSVPAAVEFSFLLGFATLTVASGYKVVTDGSTVVEQFGLLDPLIGGLFAFLAAVLAIKWLITYLETHSLSVFAWYRFGAAAATAALLVGGVI